MSTFRRSVALAVLGLTLALAVPLATSTPVSATPAAPREEGFQIVEKATYRLDPAGTAVHVDIVTDITNQSPSYTSGGYIRQAYLPRYGLPILAEATNITATTGDGSPMDLEIEGSDNPLFAYAVADIAPDLFYPDSTTVHITYDLPSLPPRSEGVSRVNPAYALFPVQIYGDAGLCDVEVIVPAGFDVDMSDTQLTKEDRGAEVAYVARAIADPDDFFTIVSARNDKALVERDVATDGLDVSVRAWPGDTEWVDFAVKYVQQGIPVLETLIGQPWQGDDNLEIIETSAPYIRGYGGWYVKSKSLIEIGDDLDGVTIAHELAHAWFNEDLFASRWINEAFAEVYGREVTQRFGDPAEPWQPADPSEAAAFRLNDWPTPAYDDPESHGHERYGYSASLTVLDGIRTEIGYEGLAKVIDAAYDRLISYQGDGIPEAKSAAPDWRRFLDLLTDIGGSTLAEGLFGTYVVGSDEEAVFATRAASRAVYAALKQRGGAFSPPVAVRQAMHNWDFPTADPYMGAANVILDTRDQIAALLAPIGVAVPKGLESAYEQAESQADLVAAAQLATELLAAAQLIVAADAKVHAAHGPLERIGAWFGNPEGTLRDAKFAFDHGAAARASAEANDAIDAVDDANLIALNGLVATLVAAGLAYGIGRRARDEMASRAGPP